MVGYGEYGTKPLVLDRYDAMARAIDSDPLTRLF